MEGFPLDAICADYRTGRHFYDGEATMPEEEETACAIFSGA